jgi:hypothetical protein
MATNSESASSFDEDPLADEESADGYGDDWDDFCEDPGKRIETACKEGLSDEVRALLRSGASMSESQREAALFAAAIEGQTQCIQLLLENEGFRFTVRESGGVALSLAARCEKIGTLKALLASADVKANQIVDPDGRTPLIEAVRLSEGEDDLVSSAMVEAVGLLARASDPNARDHDGWTALMHACKNGREGLLRTLLPHADPLLENVRRQSAIDIAVSREAWACADALAPASDPYRAERAFREGGPELMPGWAAWREAEKLREATQGSGSMERARLAEETKSEENQGQAVRRRSTKRV